MTKKYNNKSNRFADWTIKKLKDEAVAYNQSIYEIGCYGTKDLMAYNGIVAELHNRGYRLCNRICVVKN